MTASALASACGDDPGPTEAGPSIVGTWSHAATALRVDAEGGVFVSSSGTDGLANPDVVANYLTDGMTLSIADESGPQSCDTTIVGRYDFVVSATSLSFALVADGCRGRTAFLTAGQWTRR